MLILGLDFETTWSTPVNPKVARPLEVGAVLYDFDKKKPMRIYSNFIREDDHPVSPNELVELTGITDEMRETYGLGSNVVMQDLLELMDEADYILAHNGNEFDKIIYESECERLGLKPVEKPWLDTKTDLPLPEKIKTSKLTYLAAEHGFSNPFQHRAIFDVLTMIKIVEYYDVNEVIKLSKEPNLKLIAQVSYNDRQLAKDRGYYWVGEEKKWTKVIKASKLQKEQDGLPFPIQTIEV